MPRSADGTAAQQNGNIIRVPPSVGCCATAENRAKIIERFRQARELFATLTAPIRISVALLLFHLEEACVCEIQYALGESRQPLVSYHLREMKKAGFLRCVKRGRWRYYSLTAEKRSELARLIDHLEEG